MLKFTLILMLFYIVYILRSVHVYIFCIWNFWMCHIIVFSVGVNQTRLGASCFH